jgi:hypothetical protein
LAGFAGSMKEILQMFPKLFNPSHVTKPLQLLAQFERNSLLVKTGLIGWIGAHLEFYSAIIVTALVCLLEVLGLAILFILITRYRPQLLDDEHYNKLVKSTTQQVQSDSLAKAQTTGKISSPGLTITNLPPLKKPES